MFRVSRIRKLRVKPDKEISGKLDKEKSGIRRSRDKLDKESPDYVSECENGLGDRIGGHRLAWVGQMRPSRLRERNLVWHRKDIWVQINLVRGFVKMWKIINLVRGFVKMWKIE
jgi:hypothetical protein